MSPASSSRSIARCVKRMTNSGARQSAASGMLSVQKAASGTAMRARTSSSVKSSTSSRPALARRQAAAEIEHRHQQEPVRKDEDAGRESARHGLAAADAGKPIGLRDRPRGDAGRDVVRDVERRDVPRVALLEPVGDAVDDDEQDQELGRQQQRARHDEDDRRMEDPATVEVEREKLGDGRQRREEREAEPVGRRRGRGGKRDPECRRPDDGEPVEPGPESQRPERGARKPQRRSEYSSGHGRSRAISAKARSTFVPRPLKSETTFVCPREPVSWTTAQAVPVSTTSSP